MKMREFRGRLLLAIAAIAHRGDFNSFFEAAEAADVAKLERRPGQLRMVVEELDRSGLISPSYTISGSDEGGIQLRLTARGIEEAEDLLELHPEYADAPSAGAPAADRYVAFSDNQQRELRADLKSLQEGVRGDNEVPEESREIALSEIAAFEATICQSRISTELVERFTNKILSWLLKTFSAATVGVVAKALIEKLIPLLVK